MEKKYVSPEVKVVEMEATTLMAASGGVSATGENGSMKGFSTSAGDDEVGMPTMSSAESDE